MSALTSAGEAPQDLQPATSSRQPQPLIVSLFALYGRDPYLAIPVSAIVKLMADVGVEEPATRSALMRLKRGAVLQSVRDRTASYRLNPELEDVFREGDERIFAPTRSHPGDAWVLVSFSVPEAQRNMRYRIRRILSLRGFGTVGAGLWIAPASAVDHLRRELLREELLEFAEFFVGHPFEAPVAEKVHTWWDIPALEAMYAGFVERFRAVLNRWRSEPATSDSRSQAFADYLSTVTAWRRLPFLDPGIPLQYLPEGWQGLAAEQLFAELHDLLAKPSRRYVQSVMNTS